MTAFQNLKGDVFGGLTAAVVALPLALAFGVTSGLGPIAGLYGAIATGFFAAVFGGTRSQVSGPTGPMTVVMGAIVASHADNLPEAFTIVMLGGALQIVFGAARLGRYIVYTPYSVISGFMTGIGLIIIIIEILPFLGLPAADGGPLGTLRALLSLDSGTLHWQAVILASLSLLITIFWPTRVERFIPAPLAALTIGTITSLTVLPGAPVIGEVPTGLPSLVLPSIAWQNLGDAVQAGFILALLGSIDSLLTSLVADSVTRTTHNPNKELIGQGIGNICAGLIGGLPGAGATMRTVVNVRAGGRTPISGALHAMVLLALVMGLSPLASFIPHAVLSGILIKVGWDIIDWLYVRRIAQVPREKAVVMVVTLALTVFVDLITAVAVGIILAAFVNARQLEAEQVKGIVHSDADADTPYFDEEERSLLRATQGKILVTHLRGSFSFASARALVQRIGPKMTGNRIVIYDFGDVGYLDPSAAIAINDLVDQSLAQGQVVILCGLAGIAERTLRGFGVLERVGAENVYADRHRAVKAAAQRLAHERSTENLQ